MTVAPAARACSAVSSAEPSSTTRTGRCSSAASDHRPDPRTLVVARDQRDESGWHGTECTGRGRPVSDARLIARALRPIPIKRTVDADQVRFPGNHIGEEDVADRAASRTVALRQRRQRTDEPVRREDGAFGQRNSKSACRAPGWATPQPVEEHDQDRRGDQRERDRVDGLDRGEGHSLTHAGSVAVAAADGMGRPARIARSVRRSLLRSGPPRPTPIHQCSTSRAASAPRPRRRARAGSPPADHPTSADRGRA